MKHSEIIKALLASEEPSVRWKVRVKVLGDSRETALIKDLEQQVKASPRVRSLLEHLTGPQGPQVRYGVYDKWQGAQWVLMTLADIGYPRGDKELLPIVDAVCQSWLSERFFNEFVAEKKSHAYKRRDAVPVMEGRHRTCASQQGNALHSIHALGFDDPRLDELAERLRYWQWPDGGWNCDKEPKAKTSTFIHTLYSMRGLALHAKVRGCKESTAAAKRASEFFLQRKLFRRRRDNKIIHKKFTLLHYPLYWHYDILGALKIFAEMDAVTDERLHEALELLEHKALPSGWPAEERYYKKVTDERSLGSELVDWGGTSRKKANPWVTADALYVLSRFGRLDRST